MERIICPVCHQEGVLQWKETVTIYKGKKYVYKKLYVYHHHPKEHPERPKWCYLTKQQIESLNLTQKEFTITQNQISIKNLNLSSKIQKEEESCRARSSAWLERQAHNLLVAGSNPAGPTISPAMCLNAKSCLFRFKNS